MTNKDSQLRAEKLKQETVEYMNAKQNIPSGLDIKLIEKRKEFKQRILDYFQASEEDWNDYKWHLANSIRTIEVLTDLLDLSEEEIKGVREVEKKYRWKISPYYLSLIGYDKFDPVKLQAIPTILEDVDEGEVDPMDEEHTNPAGSITRRYPDRLIINVTNVCAMYCRHCQRRRGIGGKDIHQPNALIKESIEYVRNNPEIRDILLTGGDAFMLSDEQIDVILYELTQIPHVEMIRLGTRSLVTLPQRVTDELCHILQKYHPVYVNTHFNHPSEITPEVMEATDKLSRAGVPLANQAVLLNGINNDKFVMQRLNHLLMQVRIRPYYLFHAKNVIGTTHFIPSIEDGLEIMDHLRGHTSGMAIPTYIINAPKGYGKIPILPEYIIEKGDTYTLRTWEGRIVKYKNHKSVPYKDRL